MNKITIGVIALIVIGLGFYLFRNGSVNKAPITQTPDTTLSTSTPATPVAPADNGKTVIGKSVEGRDITAYHFGAGSTELLFVGGIHGGYEWNTALVAYQMVDYLKANPNVVPANLKVTVIPVLNPDGLSKVVENVTSTFAPADVSSSQTTQVAGRFNAHTVDLNRNFDCDWQSSGVWQNKTVSAGTAAFSEPESRVMQNYVSSNKPAAVVAWFSSAGGVYSSNCHTGVSPQTAALTHAFAVASGYPAHESFDFYATTGDMTNWLAKSGIPAISVLLTNHTDTEWSKNQAGILALFKYYTK